MAEELDREPTVSTFSNLSPSLLGAVADGKSGLLEKGFLMGISWADVWIF